MPSSLVRNAAIIGACVLFALLAVRIALVEGLPPATAAKSILVRNHPGVADEALWAGLGSRGNPPGYARLATGVATRLPLSGSPFAAQGHGLIDDDVDEAGLALLEEARRRDPRKRAVRLLLIQSYAEQGDADRVAAELVTLSRLMPNSNELIVAQLAQLAAHPQTSMAIRKALRSSDLLEGILNYMARQGASPAAILAMAQDRDPSIDREPIWKSYVVSRIVDDGNVERAFAIWQSLFDVASGDAPIYNSQFRDLPGGAPFNWTFGVSDVGAAEPTGQGGLDVVFYGRQSGDLASQLLRLTPGRYRLSVVFEGSKRDGAGNVHWTVRCNGRTEPLAELPMAGPQYEPTRLSTGFTVPPGCRSQWLSLRARAAEFPVTSDMRMSELTLRPSK